MTTVPAPTPAPPSLPDPLIFIRHCTFISPFTPDPDYPGQLVARVSTWMFLKYRTGLWGVVPAGAPLLLPVGMAGGKGQLGQLWLKQELTRLGSEMQDDLLCLAITGGVKLKGRPRKAGGRTWRWRAVEELHFLSPAKVEMREKATVPKDGVGAEDRVEIGMIVVGKVAGKQVEALVPKKRARV